MKASYLKTSRNETDSDTDIWTRRLPSYEEINLQHQTLTLNDGRTLGFATYGVLPPSNPNPKHGHKNNPTHPIKTIFYFHTLSSSRLEAANFASAAFSPNARIIVIDRPSLGLSSLYTRGRRRVLRPWKRVEPKVLDWPAYVAQLARFLGLQRTGYYVLGNGVGVPYALACAYALPREELLGVEVMASVWPWDVGREGVWGAVQEEMEGMVERPGEMVRWLDRSAADEAWEEDRVNARHAMEMVLDMFPGCEKEVFKKDEERHLRLCMDAERVGYRQGAEGAVQNMRLVALDWGFRLEDIEFEGIRLFYGEEDEHTPVEMGRYYAAVLPNAVIREFTGDTNIKVFADRAEEVLRCLLGETRGG